MSIFQILYYYVGTYAKYLIDIFFSFCGTYLASQGGSPDQNLTIWNWEEEEMVAQKAAPASEHYHLAFSHEHYTKITSCGKVFQKNLVHKKILYDVQKL